MKKLLVLLVLLLHINTSMFIPVLDEQDVYDEQGNQICDINSLIQFVDQVVLGHGRTVHNDQDDDHAHFFNSFHHIHPHIGQKKIVFEEQHAGYAKVMQTQQYSIFSDADIESFVGDIIVPPPDIA